MATSPFVISGLKAAQPGGLGSTISNTNTLKPAFTAAASQQRALGKPGNSAIASLLMGPQASQPVATRSVAPTQNMFTQPKTQTTQPSTPLKSTATSPDGTTTQTFHAPAPAPTFTTPSGAVVNSSTGQPESVPPSFSGTVGSLIDTSRQGSPAAQGYTSQTAAAGQGNVPIGQSAAGIAADYGKKIADVGQQAAIGEQSVGGQGIMPVAMGRAQQIAQTASEAQTALATGEEAALQGTGQQLTAQNQEASAFNNAAGQANTSQNLQQTGLTSAAGLQQPSASYPFVFNPTTGTFTNAGGGVLSAQDAAQAVIGGKMSYDQAKASLGYLGGTGEAQLQQSILGAGGDPLALQAQGSATQSNIQTAGTAGTQANQQVFNKAYGEYTDLQNSVQNVDQFGQLLTQNMGGINPSDVKYANQTIAQIRSQLSSGQQAQFDSTLAALTSKVSGLLSVGGNEIPTDVSTAANKIIDGSLPVGSLTAVLSRIQAEGNILLQNQAQKVNTAYAGIQGGNINQNANTSTTASPWH